MESVLTKGTKGRLTLAEQLTKEIYTIYESVKPTFLRQAKRFRVPNPENFVSEWLTDAYLIADKIDKQRIENNKLFLEVQDLKNFKGYLVTSFKNDIMKRYTLTKLRVGHVTSLSSNSEHNLGSRNSLEGVAAPPSEYKEGYKISDLRSAVALDINVQNKKLHNYSRSEYVDYLIKCSIYNGLCYLERAWDNPIVSDLDTVCFQKSKSDVASDLFAELQRYANLWLCDKALQEYCPFSQNDLAVFVCKEGMIKRIENYFSDEEAGVPANLDVDCDIKANIVINNKLRITDKQRSKIVSMMKLSSFASEEQLREVALKFTIDNSIILEKRKQELLRIIEKC